MKKSIFLIISFMLLLSSCSVMRDVRKADKHYGYGEYVEAAKIYAKAYRRIDSKDKALRAKVAYRQGDCFRISNQSIKAENAYAKAIRFKHPNDTVYLHYASVLHKNGKYKAAIVNYDIFLQNHPDNVVALNGLFACTKIEEWKEDAKNYTVRKSAKLNLKRGNFSPILIPMEYQSLLFSSSSLLKEGAKLSKITGLPENDFYFSQLDQYGQWEKPIQVEGAINSEFDEGVGCFDSNGSTLYFTRCVTKSTESGGNSKAAIYRSRRSGEKWSEPELLQIGRDTSVIYAHPALSNDGRYLFFVSDMKGGYGGKDIWRVEMEGNVFGPPENLGPDINTPGDEMFPYIRSNDELYFSSNGLPSLGGLDIFRAVYNETDSLWKVDNVLALNSNADDFGIAFFGEEERGLFSSNRKEAKGVDKIYEFGEPKSMVEVRGTVLDRNGQPVPDATIRIVNDQGTNTKIKARKDGTYSYPIDKSAQYVMLGTSRGYLNYSNQFYSKDIDTVYVMDFILTSLHLPVRLDNIFFEFDRWTLMKESAPALQELSKLLFDNPHVTIEISAHTDRKGKDEYNLNLSAKRAQAVVDYLSALGIEKERLTPQGYGETKATKVTKSLSEQYPFLKEGTILTEDYIESLSLQQQDICDQINRRCEFKVLKTTYKLF